MGYHHDNLAGSHFDAMVSHNMVAFFFVATIPVDIFVFYYIHRISLANPHFKCCNFLFKPIYPNYYYPNTQINDDENKNSLNNDNDTFSINYGRICSQFLSDKHSFIEYCIYFLQIWSFFCGFLAFYASFIFWMNLLLEFFVISTGSSSPLSIFALSALYFIMEIIFWFIRREFESLILITRNLGDVLDLGLLATVRLYNIFLCFICTLWTQLNSDNIGWKYFILFMLLRGLYHQIIYVTISVMNCIYIIITSMKHCKHFLKLICVSSTDQNIQSQSKLKSINIYIIFLWVLIFFYSILLATVPDCRHLFKTCIVMTLLYYMLIMFERGKYNNLYLLWRDQLKEQFFMVLPGTKSALPAPALQLNPLTSHTPPLKIQMQPSFGSNVSKSKFAIISDQSDDEEKDDNLRSPVTMAALTPIDYKQYWDKVNFNSHRRCKCLTLCSRKCKCHNLCFRQYCKTCCCSTDGCKWICSILLLSIFVLVTTGSSHRWLLFEEQSFDTSSMKHEFYPVCDLRYNEYLTSMDLVYLSISAHHDTQESIRNDFNNWFGADALQNAVIYNRATGEAVEGWQISHIDTNKNPFFYHIYNSEYDIDIVAIRGEPNPGLLLLDIGLWSEAVMFEMFSWIVPLTSILPKAFIRQFIQFVSIFENIVAPDIRQGFDEPVYEYVVNNINMTGNGTVILLGHSLGGSVAQIVASMLYDDGYVEQNGNGVNLIAFGVSTPGIIYSSGKFGFSVESLDKSSVSILPRRDLITHIDDHGGFVQRIECNAEEDEECHGSITSFCQLYSQCNVKLIRNMSFVKCLCHDKRVWTHCT